MWFPIGEHSKPSFLLKKFPLCSRGYPKEGVGAKHGVEINKDSTRFPLRNIQNPQYVKAPGGTFKIEVFPDFFDHETLAVSILGGRIGHRKNSGCSMIWIFSHCVHMSKGNLVLAFLSGEPALSR